MRLQKLSLPERRFFLKESPFFKNEKLSCLLVKVFFFSLIEEIIGSV